MNAHETREFNALISRVEFHHGKIDTLEEIIKAMRFMLEGNPDTKGQTVLFASKNNLSQAVQQLADEGVPESDEATLENSGTTAMHEAVKEGNTKIVEILLDEELSGCCNKDDNDVTPLDLAETNGDNEIASMLRDASSERNVQTNYNALFLKLRNK